MAKSPWIKKPRPNPDARQRLVCIPYAGGGASTFRRWPEQLPVAVEVVAVQLPGREERLMETPLDDAGTIASALAPEIQPELDRPWSLFGYSMGALVAFELARELRRLGAPPPRHLWAAAYRAPQLENPHEVLGDLSDEDFLEEVGRRYEAVPAAVRESPELLELFLPGLRADIAVCDGYVYRPEPPLDCAIRALGGRDDDQVTPAELEGWREQTTGEFALQLFGGGHFFLETAAAELLASVAGVLSGEGAA